MSQHGRSPHPVAIPPSALQSWQMRVPSPNASLLRGPSLVPSFPLDTRDPTLPSSKRHCMSRDAQAYGTLETLSFDFCTAVHIAAYYGHWQVIRQFIESSQCDPCQLFAARNSQVSKLAVPFANPHPERGRFWVMLIEREGLRVFSLSQSPGKCTFQAY